MLRLAVALVAVFVGACAFTIRKSRAELQADLDARFPVEVEAAVAALELTEPVLDFPATPGRVGLAFRFRATLPASVHAGRARVEGAIEYRRAERGFFLRDAEVTALDFDPAPGGGASLADALGARVARKAITEVAQLALAEHPVYRLDPARGEREAKAIDHLEQVEVDGQSLVLTVGW